MMPPNRRSESGEKRGTGRGKTKEERGLGRERKEGRGREGERRERQRERERKGERWGGRKRESQIRTKDEKDIHLILR